MDQHSFNSLWASLRTTLRPGTEVRGWGKARGYTDLRFRIVDVDAGAVTIDSPTVSAQRRISAGEFEKLFDLWDRYYSGRVSRKEITEISQNSSYILAIFRWYEDSTTSG